MNNENEEYKEADKTLLEELKLTNHIPVQRLQLSRTNLGGKVTTIDFTGREARKSEPDGTENSKQAYKHRMKQPHKLGHQSGKSDVLLQKSKLGNSGRNKSSLPTLGDTSARPIVLIPVSNESPEASMTWEQRIRARKHQQKVATARQRRNEQTSNYKSLTDGEKIGERTATTGWVEMETSRHRHNAVYDILDMANSELRKKGGGNWDRKQMARAFQVKESQHEWLLYNGKLQQRESVWVNRRSKLHRRSQLSIEEGKRSLSQTIPQTDGGESSIVPRAQNLHFKDQMVEKVSEVYKLDIDASYWLGEPEFSRIIGMIRNPFKLDFDNSAAGIKNSSQTTELGWTSVLHLLNVLKSYLDKLLAESFSLEEAKPHRSMQHLLLEEIKKRTVELKIYTDGKTKMLYAQDENSNPAAKATAGSLDSSSDFRKTVKDLIDWFKFAREKFGIELDNRDILPKEHPNVEKLTFDMEKIKSSLYVKNEKELMESVDRFDMVLTRVTNCAITLAHEADQLKRQNETLEGVVYKLKEEIRNKVRALQEGYDKIEIIKPPDRLKIMLDIEDELAGLKESHREELKELTSKLETLEIEAALRKTQITDLENKLTNRNVRESKGVQTTLDTEDKSKETLNDMKAYFENMNYFILGGKLQSTEWLTFLITDIFNSKLQADNMDLKATRAVSCLKTFTFQYFMKNFGCRRVGFAFLKDFYFSLSQLYQDNLRFETFLNLAGCNCLRLKQNMDMQEYLRKNKVAWIILILDFVYSLRSPISNKSLHLDSFPLPKARRRYLIFHAEPQYEQQCIAPSRPSIFIVRNITKEIQVDRRGHQSGNGQV
jgi:hypothetical protein